MTGETMATTNAPRFCVTKRTKHGTRYYWQPSQELRRAGWRAERLPADPSAAFARADQINAAVDAWRANGGQQGTPAPTGPTAGTLSALIAEYRASRFFRELARKTRHFYDHNLSFLEQWAGDIPFTEINPAMVQDLYEAQHAKKPAKAKAMVTTLRVVLSYARRRGYIDHNPASSPGISYQPEQARLWTRADLDWLVATADAMDAHSIGTALHLGYWLAQRPGDLAALRWDDYQDGRFAIRQAKTGARVDVPESPEIAARLSAEYEHQAARGLLATTILVSESSGRPYTRDHLTKRFRAVRDVAAQAAADTDGAPDVSDLLLRGLRHSGVTCLALAGCTIPEIAAISGHSLHTAQRIVDTYLVRTGELASSAADKRLAQHQGL